MLKEFNLQTFFRYFIPGAVTLAFICYLLLYVDPKGYVLPIDVMSGREKIDVGGGAIILGLTFLVGYLISTCYHIIINFPVLRVFLKMNHTDFFEKASLNNYVILRGMGIGELPVDISELSSSGSAALFDTYFYRLRRSIDEATDEKRFEGFFDVWNGLGSTLTGVLVAFLFWLLLPEIGVSKEMHFTMLLPGGIFFIVGILNWIQLRRWSRSYVEGWFIAVLRKYRDKENMPLSIYVRAEHLKPIRNFQWKMNLGPSFWRALRQCIDHLLNN